MSSSCELAPPIKLYLPLVGLVADTSSGNSWEIIEGSARENRAWEMRQRERERGGGWEGGGGRTESRICGRSEVVNLEGRTRKSHIEPPATFSV